jgi:hypothetical protein
MHALDICPVNESCRGIFLILPGSCSEGLLCPLFLLRQTIAIAVRQPAGTNRRHHPALSLGRVRYLWGTVLLNTGLFVSQWCSITAFPPLFLNSRFRQNPHIGCARQAKGSAFRERLRPERHLRSRHCKFDCLGVGEPPGRAAIGNPFDTKQGPDLSPGVELCAWPTPSQATQRYDVGFEIGHVFRVFSP